MMPCCLKYVVINAIFILQIQHTTGEYLRFYTAMNAVQHTTGEYLRFYTAMKASTDLSDQSYCYLNYFKIYSAYCVNTDAVIVIN